jgi:hypothetical protein
MEGDNMGIAQQVAARPKKRPGPKCSVWVALQRLAPDDAAELVELMARPVWDIPHVGLVGWLQGEGHDVTQSTMSRHRRGYCSREQQVAA